MGLLTASFRISNLQSCERIRFVVLSHPVVVLCYSSPWDQILWSLLHVEMINSSIMNIISSPSNSLELKTPSFYSWLGLPGDQTPIQRHPGAHPVTSLEPKKPLVPFSCEFMRVLGVQCQTVGTKTKIHSFCFHIDIKWVWLRLSFLWLSSLTCKMGLIIIYFREG